jgi:hypothetical protein
MADPGQCDADFDMSHFINEAHFANEFILDSDEGSPLPDLHDSDDGRPGPHRPHSAGADSFHAMPDAPQDCGSPSEALGLVSTSSRSADGPRGSTFGSASSKGTSTTALTQLTTGDLRMDGGANGKPSWDVMTGAFRGPNAGAFTMTDGGFDYLNGTASAQSQLQSPMDSPSPFGSALTTLSPEAVMTSPQAFDDSYLVSLLCSALRAELLLVGVLTRLGSPLPSNPQGCNPMLRPARLYACGRRNPPRPPNTSFAAPRNQVLFQQAYRGC